MSRLVRAAGWRHALGEFALIVVGVLVALWVNDWNQARIDRGRERTDLQQLLTTTQENERRIRDALGRDGATLQAVDRLMTIVEDSAGRAAPSPDSLTTWRDTAFKFAALSPLTGTYTALAQSGELNLLRNAALRAQTPEVADAARRRRLGTMRRPRLASRAVHARAAPDGPRACPPPPFTDREGTSCGCGRTPPAAPARPS